MKSTRLKIRFQRHHGKTTVHEQSKLGDIIGVFCLTGQERKNWGERPTLYFECNWKNIPFTKRERTKIFRVIVSTFNKGLLTK